MELLDRHRPALRLLPAAQLLKPRIPRARALDLTERVVKNIAAVEPLFDGELSAARAIERRAVIAVLPDLALVFYAADVVASGPPLTPAQQQRYAELVILVHEDDQYLMGWALPLFRGNGAAQAELARIRSGTGVRDDADDVLSEVVLFRTYWPTAQGQTPVTAERLDEAEARASELVRLLSATGGDEDPDSPQQLRRRAYTQWANSYNELAALGRYLERKNPEAHGIFPLIHPEGAGRTAAATITPAEPTTTAPAES